MRSSPFPDELDKCLRCGRKGSFKSSSCEDVSANSRNETTGNSKFKQGEEEIKQENRGYKREEGKVKKNGNSPMAEAVVCITEFEIERINA